MEACLFCCTSGLLLAKHVGVDISCLFVCPTFIFLFLIEVHFLLGNHLSPTKGNFDVTVNQDTWPCTLEAEANPGPRGWSLPFCQMLPCHRRQTADLKFCWSLIIPAAVFSMSGAFSLQAFPHPSSFLSD